LAVVLIVLPLLPERCVVERSFDYLNRSCNGFGDEVGAAIGLAFGALLAGAVVAALKRSRAQRRGGAIELSRAD